MNFTAIKYEIIDNKFVVELERTGGERFFVDVWVNKKYRDIDCDWNAYIFPEGKESEERKRVQSDVEEFNDASATAICYLEKEGLIKQDDRADWYLTEDIDDDFEDFDLKKTKLTYYVSILGYDKKDNIVDFDKEVEHFDNKKAAIECAEFLMGHVLDLVDMGKIKIPAKVKHLHIVIDTELEDGTPDVLFEDVVDIK